MSVIEPSAPASPALATYVHQGRDGWLFLTAGSNNVIGQFEDTSVTKRFIEGWKRIVVRREARCRRLGVGFLHVIVPEKLTVYDHKLAGLRVDIRLSPARRLRRSLLLNWRAYRACLDTVTLFREHRDDEDLFFRTDSHWSFAGCRLAYRAICRATKARQCLDFAERDHHDVEHLGDLGSKLEPPQSEIARFYGLQREARRVHASPIVEAREAAGEASLLHVGSHVVYRNDTAAADPRRIVLFGDSYSHFAPIMLTAMLAETFREVHFVWSSSVDWSYVERIKPDLLLTQVAERFMFRVPDDQFDIEAYVNERYGDELKRINS